MKSAILLATYNSDRFLGEMLSSLLNQSYTDFVCYIHDDGSKDGTMDIVRSFRTKHPDRFFILEDEKKRLGAKGNFLHLLRTVEADVYLFADADDVWMKEKVARDIEALSDLAKPDAIDACEIPLCVFSDMKVTDENLNVTADSFIRSIGRDPHYINYPEIIMDNPAAGCTMCFNRALRDAAISVDADDLVEMHDVWVLSVAAACGEVAVIDEPLLYYRQHGDNEMGAKSESPAAKVARNLGDLASGSMAKEKEAYYKKCTDLAKAILLLDGPMLKKGVSDTLKKFVNMKSMTKSERISFLRSHGFRRKHNTFWIHLWA